MNPIRDDTVVRESKYADIYKPFGTNISPSTPLSAFGARRGEVSPLWRKTSPFRLWRDIAFGRAGGGINGMVSLSNHNRVKVINNSGMSFIEVVIAMAIITVAIIGMVAAINSNVFLAENTRETSLAINAARAMVETLQDYPAFTGTFAAYSGVNASFDVTGLEAVTGAPNGKPGQIIFPGSGGRLLESVTDTRLGMPYDLNGDGDAIDDATADYKILPVTVRVEWQTRNGPKFYQLHTILVQK